MADAAASALARPRTLPAPREAAVAAGAAFSVAALAAADGGYFPTAWGWAALVALWLVATIALVGRIVRPSRLQLAFAGGILGLTAWVWLSSVWSIDVVESAHEGQRMLAYGAVAVALVLVVRSAVVSAALGGALAGIALACAYGLATRLFPDRLGVFDPIAEYRLSEPLGYWNGLGLFAAMGALLALAFAARARTIGVRALAGALPVLLLPTLYFTFGRGAWISLALALLAAVALDPRRLQLLGVLFATGAPAAAAVLAASRYEALRREDSPLALASTQGHRLALILLGLALLAAAAAAAYALLERRIEVPRKVRLGFEAALVVVAAAVALLAVFVRYGDPITLADKAHDSFTAPPPAIENDIGERLFSFSGSYRVDLWESAWRGYEEHPLLGLGAGGYEQHWLQDRPFEHKVRDAHSLYLETLAELGPVGLALLLLALGAPLAAAVAARRQPLASGCFRRVRRLPRPRRRGLGLGASGPDPLGADLRFRTARHGAPRGTVARPGALDAGCGRRADGRRCSACARRPDGEQRDRRERRRGRGRPLGGGRRRGADGEALGALVVRAVAAPRRGASRSGGVRGGRARLQGGDRARAAGLRALARAGPCDRRRRKGGRVAPGPAAQPVQPRDRGVQRRLGAPAMARDPLADPGPLIRRVYAYVAYRVGDGAEAEDVTSETFERALRYRDSYDPKRGEPVAWLIGIARRCIENARLRPGSLEHPEEMADTLDLESETLTRLTVTEAVGRLDERDRELIALRYGSDLSARQIGELLELRTNAVEVALHRALARLRTYLEGQAEQQAEAQLRERPSTL